MNRENIEYCIELMKQAKNLNMLSFQDSYYADADADEFANTVEDLHACGNLACFAGYVAISEKFKADGGEMLAGGVPRINGRDGSVAIAKWLEIDIELANGLVYGDLMDDYDDSPQYSQFYQKYFSNVTPTDVIEKLQLILDGK